MHRTASRTLFWFVVALLLLVAACGGEQRPEQFAEEAGTAGATSGLDEAADSQMTETPDPTVTVGAEPTAVTAATETPEMATPDSAEAAPSPTVAPSEPEATATVASPTASPDATATGSAAIPQTTGNTIVVDHTSVADFERIPDEYIRAAQALRMIYIDQSVGSNIYDGLTCLSYESSAQAPNHCLRYEHVDPAYSVDPGEVSWNRPGGYDRSNWEFAHYSADCPGSGWNSTVPCFVQMVDPVIDNYDVLSFQFTYLHVGEGATIGDQPGGYFSDNEDDGDVYDQQAYEAQHPDKVFIYWTTSLARGIGTEESDQFNEQMRQYAVEQGKPLFDVASILSHDPDGNPCYDNRDGVAYDNGNNSENHPDDGQDYLAICQQYTTETDGGHLGRVSSGKIRVAKAFWVLMARIAGWDGLTQ